MKILHCADIHLDSKLNTHLDGEKRKERKAEILRTFMRMVEYAADEKIEVILIAGDFFDEKHVSKTTLKNIRQSMADHPDIRFYYLKGNHDDHNAFETLEDFPENLYLFSEEWKSYILNPNGKGNIVLSGLELTGENAAYAYTSLALNARNFNIVMLHGQTANYKSKDRAETIALPALCDKGIDYLALGHIHAYHDEKLDRRGHYCYPGCLEGRGFDECGKHGFVVLDIDEEAGTFSHVFVPFAYRTIYAPEVDVTGLENSNEIVEKIRAALQESGADKNALVKIVLTGKVDVECDKNIPYIQSCFASEYYFVKVKDETGLFVDYRIYEHDESLKGEFIRTVMKDAELSEEEKGEIIRCGLMALAGEEIGE